MHLVILTKYPFSKLIFQDLMILFNSCILNCDSEFINFLEHLPMLIADFLSVSCLKYTAIILNNSRMAIMGQSKFFQLFSYRNCSIRKALFVNPRWYEIEKVNPSFRRKIHAKKCECVEKYLHGFFLWVFKWNFRDLVFNLYRLVVDNDLSMFHSLKFSLRCRFAVNYQQYIILLYFLAVLLMPHLNS